MRILFIGGTGNISADCAELLHQRGHEIAVVTRGRSAVPPAYRVVQADRKNLTSMQEALRGYAPDVVINFLGFDLDDLKIDYALFGGGNLLQYIFISSATVYQKPAPRLPITEETPLGNAYWEYAQKKLQCENWLRERRHASGFPLTIVRPSHTYSPQWIPSVTGSATYTFAARLEAGKPVFVPDDGNMPWTLTATSDFAVGLAGLAGNEKAIGEAFHITSDEALPWNQIAAEIADAAGVKNPNILRIPTEFICSVVPKMIGPLKGDKATAGVFDNSKLKRVVPDFVCKKPFHVGIRESIEWYCQHPERKQANPDADAVFEQATSAWLARREP